MSKTAKVFVARQDGSFLTPEFRVSFPKVFEPNEDGKYGLAMIFDDDVDFSALEAAVEAKRKEKWPKGAPKGCMDPILDGNNSTAAREELVDKFYINGKCGKYKPGLVGSDRNPIVDEAEFYPGCWARAVVTVYAWAFKGKCGVSVNVRNIQKLRDDEPLISRVKAEDEFEAAEVQEVSDL